MNNIISSKAMLGMFSRKKENDGYMKNLTKATIDKEYIIKDVLSNDEDLKEFLFTLGCYKGESITVISELAENYIIAVKDARYSIDKDLAEAIII